MIRKYEIEIETDDDVIPEMDGEDVDFTLCHALGQALKDIWATSGAGCAARRAGPGTRSMTTATTRR